MNLTGVDEKQACDEWMEKEGIPVYKGIAVEDIDEVPLGPWARMGGYGAFVQLVGTRMSGMLLYLAKIPAGGALEPEKHMYDELIYVMRGRGLAEVWQEGEAKRTFEWGEGSWFAMPLNAWHRLVNGGQEPVLLMVNTTAPTAIAAFRNAEFVYNCDYKFTDRYKGQTNYFLASKNRHKVGKRPVWETNFVPDVNTAYIDDFADKAGPGGKITWIWMTAWPSMHLSEWPMGKYHKAHCHGPGAILVGLKSKGYALVWPQQYGPHPFQDGHGDKVVKVSWKPNSIYTSGAGPGDWFHQHFNTGPEPARHLNPMGSAGGEVRWGGAISVREPGGRLVEYEDEDPEIRRMFEEELRQNGVECTMPKVVYRTDPFPHFQPRY